MRENRTCGSEGGEPGDRDSPTPTPIMKLSYSGDEPEYVRFHKRKVPTFPHEPTSDQFFDETKFEVYRALGHHVAEQALGDSKIRDLLKGSDVAEQEKDAMARDKSTK